MISKVIVKVISSIILKIIEMKRHPSISVIRLLINFHGMFLLFAREFPSVEAECDKIIEDFLASEENRNKTKLPNIIMIFVCLLISNKYTFKDVINTYFLETLDRQVFWII
jgi:hypothetical protein